MDVKIEQSWKDALAPEFGKPYFEQLVRFLHGEKAAGKVIYPPGSQIFRAFELTPVDQVKVVILGQDPYHGPGQAMGLSFSVPDGVPAPPSLRNIFQEVETDLGIRMSGRPNLEKWARQGVLLLNAVLTVQAGQPSRLAGVHGRRYPLPFGEQGRHRFPALGPFCGRKGGDYRFLPPPCAPGGASFAPCPRRLLWLPPFLQDQPNPSIRG